MNKKKVKKYAIDLVFWIIGNFFYALAFNYFLTPNKISIGGVTGLAGIIHYLWAFIPAGAVTFVLNIPLFIAAWRKFGSGFIVNTVIAVAINALMLDIQPKFIPEFHGNIILATIFGGLCAGLGQGLILGRDATTGGMDIAGRLLRLKFEHLSLGTLELLMNTVVIVASAIVYRSVESMLYSILVVWLTGKAIDFVVYGANRSKMLLVVTTHGDEISREITSTTPRGVTKLPVQGGYTETKRELLICVIKRQEVARTRRMIMKFDENPFIVVADVSEVLGLGFKSHNDTL